LKLDGHDFLKKIVQYSVHLPPIPTEDLARLLDEDLSKVIGSLSDDDSRRIGGTWFLIFRHYLRTPRDVRLFINAVTVAASRGFEHVDPVDLIIIELLRLYDPEVYWWIRENLSEVSD
jgi:predicted KAP-like P-loop ATPase